MVLVGQARSEGLNRSSGVGHFLPQIAQPHPKAHLVRVILQNGSISVGSAARGVVTLVVLGDVEKALPVQIRDRGHTVKRAENICAASLLGVDSE